MLVHFPQEPSVIIGAEFYRLNVIPVTQQTVSEQCFRLWNQMQSLEIMCYFV